MRTLQLPDRSASLQFDLMTPETHRLALRAAAKLALSALLPLAPFAAVACGSAGSGEATTPTSASNELTSASDAGTPKEVALYCAALAPDASPRDCCDTELATASFGDDAGTDSLTLGCCDVLIHTQDPWASDKLGECCYALGTPHGPACTPWGPPVPPAMGWRRGALSAVQVLAA